MRTRRLGPVAAVSLVGALVGLSVMGGPPTTGAIEGADEVGALVVVATGTPVLQPVVCDLFVPVVV